MAKRITYEPYGHFMLRAPLLPLELLNTIPNSPAGLYPWLKEKWKDKLVREGIALASFEFSKIIDEEFSKPEQVLPDSGLLHAMVRYLCRFSSRCTPFGTFAGFSTGTIGPATAVCLGERTEHTLHARPDMEFLMGIARYLEKQKEVREELIYSGNTSVYRVGSRWHYIEVKIPGGKYRKVYDIVTIDDNGVIGDVLDFCEGGKIPADIRKFLNRGGWEESDVYDFVESLIDSQVIVTTLEPVICGPEYIDCLLLHLKPFLENHEAVQALLRLRDLFKLMDRPSSVLEILPILNPVLACIPVPVNLNHLIQVDMMLVSKDMTVDPKITGQVLLGLRILKSLSSPERQDVMKGFREAYLKRYGERRVKLVHALDPETGIGMEGSVEGYWTDPVPWIDDLHWGRFSGAEGSEFNSGKGWLAEQYHDTIRSGKLYVDLQSEDLRKIGIHDGNWPSQMTAMVEIFEHDLAGEHNIHVLMGTTGNPAFLLGRFGFADAGNTRDWISQLIEDEQAENPDTVFAEVVHLPEDRTGNVLQRPSFLRYEIPYLAGSDKTSDDQISISDLMIGLENQKIILYSEKSGKKIRPCMTNAYNHQIGNLAVYKFLYRIQLQDSSLSFQPDWGDSIRSAPFCPGIRFKNLILSSPVWLIRCSDLSGWFHPGDNSIEIEQINAWRINRQMPDEMLWMSSDQELFFNWTNPNLLMALWDVIHKYSLIRVRPFYLSGGTPVKSPDGSHANQFVFCYQKS